MRSRNKTVFEGGNVLHFILKKAVELADYKITTDILAPSEKKTIEYSGFHPSRLIKLMPEILKSAMIIKSKDIFEDKIKWDVSSDPISFYGEWHINYTFDVRSKAKYKIVLQGSQSAKDKMGSIKISIKGAVETSFPFTTFLHRSVFWIYNYAFYNKQRRQYLETARILIDRVEDEIRSTFSLIKRGG